MKEDIINFVRLTSAIFSVCTALLREVLLQHVPMRDVKTAIMGHEPMFSKVLNPDQKRLLFNVETSNFSVENFDLNLLYTLIRKVSTVNRPFHGWGQPVCYSSRDRSIGANVERIRQLRNQIFGHANANITDAEFDILWSEIEYCVEDLEKALYLPSGSYTQLLQSLKIDTEPKKAIASVSKSTGKRVCGICI